MNNNINVEISDLGSAVSTIETELANVNEIITTAKEAGQAAINALGGSGTPAGGAVDSKMITINEEEFEKTSKSITNFLESLGKVQNTYTQAEEDFVNLINSFGSSDSK